MICSPTLVTILRLSQNQASREQIQSTFELLEYLQRTLQKKRCTAESNYSFCKSLHAEMLNTNVAHSQSDDFWQSLGNKKGSCESRVATFIILHEDLMPKNDDLVPIGHYSPTESHLSIEFDKNRPNLSCETTKISNNSIVTATEYKTRFDHSKQHKDFRSWFPVILSKHGQTTEFNKEAASHPNPYPSKDYYLLKLISDKQNAVQGLNYSKRTKKIIEELVKLYKQLHPSYLKYPTLLNNYKALKELSRMKI